MLAWSCRCPDPWSWRQGNPLCCPCIKCITLLYLSPRFTCRLYWSTFPWRSHCPRSRRIWFRPFTKQTHPRLIVWILLGGVRCWGGGSTLIPTDSVRKVSWGVGGRGYYRLPIWSWNPLVIPCKGHTQWDPGGTPGWIPIVCRTTCWWRK